MRSESPEYSPNRRAQNQRNIILGSSVALGVLFLSGLMQSWSMGSYIAGAVVILAVALLLWWLFGAQSARPLPTDRAYARWPYLSKKTLDEISNQKRK